MKLNKLKKLRPSLLQFLTIPLVLSALLSFGTQSYAASGNICFCHETGSGFETICTSDDGQQNGHTNHGDPDFGCLCGDGICDANDGEDQYTCPQDCGAPPACNDGTVDVGEECGEPGLICNVAGETCVGCRCTPPPPECFVDGDCADGNPCNGDESCDQDRTCVPGNNLDCDDNNPCNGNETCDPQQGCQSGTPVVCDDQRSCSTDTCNQQNGLCDFDVSACDCDSDADCDDGNPCTDDSCDVSPGDCLNNTDDTNTCDDGNACTENDACTEGLCGGQAVSCDDQNPCTDDSCNPATGCEAVNDDTNLCDDGNVCNGDENCQAGNCASGAAVVCDDERACTADSCNSQDGLCVFDTANCGCSSDADCNDGNNCTTDSCDTQRGACGHQEIENCGNNNPNPAPAPVPSLALSGSGNGCSLNAAASQEGYSSWLILGAMAGLFGWRRRMKTSDH